MRVLSQVALILSWLVYAPCARFVALDLGYSSDERAFFEKIKKSLPADVRFEIETFPFDQYPIHYMLKPGKVDSLGRPQGRTYAWKVSFSTIRTKIFQENCIRWSELAVVDP